MLKINLENKNTLYKKFKSIFFEYYKQGFLFRNYMNRSLYSTKEELKSLIFEDFYLFFEKNYTEYREELQNNDTPSSPELSCSDLIGENPSETQTFTPKSDSILTTCPLCKKQIKAIDINLQKINLSEIDNFPFAYLYIHSFKNSPPHALLLYFDAHFKVRGRKLAKYSNLKS